MVKKRIAVIGLKGLPAFGGAANVGENIIGQLSDKYVFTVYSIATHTSHQGPYRGAEQIVFRKFPIRALNVFYYYFVSALHAVFTRRYDLVHLHQMDGAFILLLLRLKYKVISTSHGLTYKHAKWNKIMYPYFKVNEWFQAHLSNHLTVVSRSLIPHYARMIPMTRITYIPNGINPAPISDTFNSPPSGYLMQKEYILFAAGRIIPTKGLHILLNALHLCQYKGKLIVLGDYRQQASYSEKLQELSSGLDVEYKGLIKDKNLLDSYIRHAGIFIFPSTYEAMSMMLLEVASLKTPVVCSDIQENTDVFDKDEMLFFHSGSETDLADKIVWAFHNGVELGYFANKAFNKLINNYLWSGIAMQYDHLYEELTSIT